MSVQVVHADGMAKVERTTAAMVRVEEDDDGDGDEDGTDGPSEQLRTAGRALRDVPGKPLRIRPVRISLVPLEINFATKSLGAVHQA